MGDEKRKKLSLDIIKTLRKTGYKAYLVGGCVRDMLMQTKSADYDIVTDALPENVIKLFKRTVEVGIQFGVVRVIMEDYEFEIATFRKDGEYLDGRRPESVSFTDEKEDVYRRDFTINGLLYDPITNKIIDYVGGEADINNKIIRTIGDPEKRFSEDYLRLIRAVRFASRFDFTIEENTYNSILKMAHNIVNVSKERIREELTKIFKHKNKAIAIQYLMNTGLLKFIFPSIYQYYKSNTTYFRYLSEIMKNYDTCNLFELYFSLMYIIFYFEKLYKKELDNNILHLIENELKSLKFSNAELKSIIEIFKVSFSIWNIECFPIWKVKRLFRSNMITYCIGLNLIINDVLNLDNSNVELCKKKLNEYKDTIFIQPFINGDDLIELGYQSGKIFSEILFDVENKQLEDKIKSKNDAITYIKSQYPL